MKKEYLLGSLVLAVIIAGALSLGFRLSVQDIGVKHNFVKHAIAVPQTQGGIIFSPPGQLESVKLNKTISEDETISLGDIGKIYGLSINAKVNLISDNSLVRAVLVSGEDEYLVYEGYPAIINKGQIVINNFCEETCALDGIKPDSLKIQIENATLNLRSINFINSYGELETALKSKGIVSFNKEIKEKQDKLKIKKINEKKSSWVAGETSVSGFSYQEKKGLFGIGEGENDVLPNLQGFEYYKGGVFEIKPNQNIVAEAPSDSIPESDQGPSGVPEGWDWRNRHGINWATPVKDQRYCGSCWAFAAVGSTELLANLYFNDSTIDFNLSEQEITSCADYSGCHGGYPSRALDHIRDNGVVDETCYPYVAIDAQGCNSGTSCTYEPQLCTDKCSDPVELVKIGGRHNFYSSSGEEELKRLIIEYGAVSGGLYSMNHAMNLVGFKKDPTDGATIWIFKNSWGVNWGEAGFANLKKPISDFGWTHALLNPVISEKSQYDILCTDTDNDGYCNWGISENKPSTCPISCSGNTEKDCDDSNYNLAGFDSNYNCININACSETDGGKDYETAGQVIGIMIDGGENFDYCVSDTELRETFCNGIRGDSEIYVCPDICRDGACVTRSCSDSDGGKVYDVEGEITGYMADDSPNYDYCVENGDLYEVFCLDGLGYNELYSCLPNGICQNGKCVEITPPTVAITYPEDNTAVADKFINITANASSNVQKVDFYINGAYKSTDSSVPFGYKLNTRPYGIQTIVIKALATADNELQVFDEATVTIGGDPDPVETECNDGKDNDGDGTCDWNGIPYKNKIFPGMDPDEDCVDQYDPSESE